MWSNLETVYALFFAADASSVGNPSIRDWVLIPIMVVMILVGVVRHQITLLLSGDAKPSPLKSIRETHDPLNALRRAILLRQHANHIPQPSFHARRTYLCAAFDAGSYLKNPADKDNGPANPMTDPQGMEVMMDGMKKNMMMIIPQTLIMGWVNFFFSGFVLIRLPFPLTVRFKSMLQRGVETSDMDVAWVSSLSWYFLNLFGLRGVYSMILGEDNVADGMKEMQAMSTMGMQQQAQGQVQDWNKLFLAEKENLELFAHEWELEKVEQRVLRKYAALSRA